MDRFETPYQPPRRSADPMKFFLKRFLVFLVIFGVIVIGWMIIHPLAPGSVSVSISAPTRFLAGAPEKIKVTMNGEHGFPHGIQLTGETASKRGTRTGIRLASTAIRAGSISCRRTAAPHRRSLMWM